MPMITSNGFKKTVWLRF